MSNKRLIIKIEKNSIAKELSITAGDYLISINGKDIKDVFDYRYLIDNDVLEVLIEKANGEVILYEIEKYEDEDLGIIFESGLMDEAKSCHNNCIFCFIDQLPKNMRKTLYFKDDDSRLSFLQGNYITLTNMKDEDINHIIFYHLSPINISVHTTDLNLRKFMLRNNKIKDILPILQKFFDANIEMNFQVVLCKNINDDKNLDKTILDLSSFLPKSKSLSIVPVGLTRFRENLFNLEEFTKQDSIKVINQINNYQKQFLLKNNTRFVFASDEFYLKSGLSLPDYNDYEDFPQFENGVGMLSLFKYEFLSYLQNLNFNYNINNELSIVTGVLAKDFIKDLIFLLKEKFPNLKINIYPIINNFFGEKITVSGLLTGTDIIDQLKNKSLGKYVLIPQNLLKNDDDILLDDISIFDLEKQLNTKFIITRINGEDFLKKVLEITEDYYG